MYIITSSSYRYSDSGDNFYVRETSKKEYIIYFGYSYNDLDVKNYEYIVIPKKSQKQFIGIWHLTLDMPKEFYLDISYRYLNWDEKRIRRKYKNKYIEPPHSYIFFSKD